MANEYKEYSAKISEICQKYNFPNCIKCPLYCACCSEKQDTETAAEYTERIETALVEAYKKLNI